MRPESSSEIDCRLPKYMKAVTIEDRVKPARLPVRWVRQTTHTRRSLLNYFKRVVRLKPGIADISLWDRGKILLLSVSWGAAITATFGC